MCAGELERKVCNEFRIGGPPLGRDPPWGVQWFKGLSPQVGEIPWREDEEHTVPQLLA